MTKRIYMTVQEVADYVRVSSMTIYRLVKAGELPATQVGRSFRIKKVDIDAYLRAHTTGTDNFPAA